MEHPNLNDESRVYVGNLDLRITEAALIKMFSPFGKIASEDFLWHTRGPKRGEPRGYAFIQFSSKEEAILAKDKMHGRMACGRPLVVRLATHDTSPLSSNAAQPSVSSGGGVGGGAQPSRTAKIAAIKNKLKAIDEENHKTSKKQKQKQTQESCTQSPQNTL